MMNGAEMSKKKAVRESIATWWRIQNYSPKIDPLEVVYFTASFVTYLEKQWCFKGPDVLRERRARRDDIFPSFDEAKAEAIRRATVKVEYAKNELQRCRSALEQWESIKQPEATA